MNQCFITVFTPTYNRQELLMRLYYSLEKQESKNFEWLIIDDGSTDDTESIVRRWMERNNSKFSIRYFKQNHGGKHRAINKAFKLAKGSWFFIVDSDDYLLEDATKLIGKWAGEVENRDDIAAVSGLKLTCSGACRCVPQIRNNDWIEASNLERGRYNLWGDKAEIYKTDIIKRYPFPEFEGEYFVTEAVCWDAIAADGYAVRWYNQPIYICEYLEDGLTKSGVNGIKGNIDNYRGFSYYVSQCIRVKSVWEWLGNLRRYNKVARVLHKTWKERAEDLNISLLKYVLHMVVVFPYIYFAKGLCKIFKG